MRRPVTAILLGVIAAVAVAAMDTRFTYSEGILYVAMAALGFSLGARRSGQHAGPACGAMLAMPGTAPHMTTMTRMMVETADGHLRRDMVYNESKNGR